MADEGRLMVGFGREDLLVVEADDDDEIVEAAEEGREGVFGFLIKAFL